MSLLNGIIEEFSFGTGLLEDTRLDDEKVKDYQHEEIISAPLPVVWTEKTEKDWRKFPIYNQGATSSCVSQAVAKCMGIENFIEHGKYLDFSRRFIYANRKNKPEKGMSFPEAMEYVRQVGIPLEYLVPSENLTEAQINDSSDIKSYIVKIANVFQTLGYVSLPYDIESIASVIETGKGVLLGFKFNYSEWTAVPEIIDATTILRHAVAGVDYTLLKGKKMIVIEDSWGSQTAINGRRLIDQKFLKERCIFAGYFLNLVINTPSDIPKPRHNFTVNMAFGQTNDEIKALQECLQYERLFPTNITASGYYGAITKKAVEGFQLKYSVAEASSPAFGTVGPATRKQLNMLFNS